MHMNARAWIRDPGSRVRCGPISHEARCLVTRVHPGGDLWILDPTRDNEEAGAPPPPPGQLGIKRRYGGITVSAPAPLNPDF